MRRSRAARETPPQITSIASAGPGANGGTRTRTALRPQDSRNWATGKQALAVLPILRPQRVPALSFFAATRQRTVTLQKRPLTGPLASPDGTLKGAPRGSEDADRAERRATRAEAGSASGNPGFRLARFLTDRAAVGLQILGRAVPRGRQAPDIRERPLPTSRSGHGARGAATRCDGAGSPITTASCVIPQGRSRRPHPSGATCRLSGLGPASRTTSWMNCGPPQMRRWSGAACQPRPHFEAAYAMNGCWWGAGVWTWISSVNCC